MKTWSKFTYLGMLVFVIVSITGVGFSPHPAARMNGASAMVGLATLPEALQGSNIQTFYPNFIDPWVQEAVLTSPDGAAFDYLGGNVAISADGSTVVVGQSNKKVNSNTNQGIVYVFVKSAGGWASGITTAKLTASDGASQDYLGGAVAISGDGSTIAAGASAKTIISGNRGAVYVFVKPTSGGWAGNLTETARLTASDGATNDRLGGSVAVSSNGTTIVAGASSKSSNKGQVYLFTKPSPGGWAGNLTEAGRLTASDGIAGDGLGNSVAVSGDGATVVAGASWRKSAQGAAYIFVKPAGLWANVTQKAILTNSDFISGESDLLGSSVGISSDGLTVAAGAPWKYIGGVPSKGKVYVFVKPTSGGWVDAAEKAQLKDSTDTSYTFLGTSVAVSTDGAVVAAGAPLQESIPAPKAGAILLYNRPASGWANAFENSRLAASGVTYINRLGYSVAMSGSIIVTGAPYTQVSGNVKQGAVYLFKQNVSKVYLPVMRK